MRPILRRVLDAHMTGLLFVAAATLLYALHCEAQGSATVWKDGRAVTIYGVDREPIASLVHAARRITATLEVDHLDLVISPSHRYQWATETSAGYNEGTSVKRDVYEITSADLGTKAATRSGWRNPLRLDRYCVPVTWFESSRRSDGQIFVQVRTDPERTGFVVEMLTIRTKTEPHP